MNYTIQDVIDKMRSLAPPLKEVPEELLTAWVVLAEEFVCASKFGSEQIHHLSPSFLIGIPATRSLQRWL